MRAYLDLWIEVGTGLLAFVSAIILPIVFLLLELLPYGVTALVSGQRLKVGYRWLYFLPKWVKDITKSSRK